jgi:hypothetical protein
MAPLPISSGASLLIKRMPHLPSFALFKRQQTSSSTPEIIPTTYGNLNSGPPPGTVVGIVLGSVAGFLLLLWLFYTCFNIRRPVEDESVVEEVVVRDKRKRHSRGMYTPFLLTPYLSAAIGYMLIESCNSFYTFAPRLRNSRSKRWSNESSSTHSHRDARSTWKDRENRSGRNETG